MDGVADTPEKMDRYIKTIYNKANEMDLLINELTLYSKIDTNLIGLPELLQKDKKYTASSRFVFPIPFCPKKQFSLAENPISTCSRFL